MCYEVGMILIVVNSRPSPNGQTVGWTSWVTSPTPSSRAANSVRVVAPRRRSERVRASGSFRRTTARDRTSTVPTSRRRSGDAAGARRDTAHHQHADRRRQRLVAHGRDDGGLGRRPRSILSRCCCRHRALTAAPMTQSAQPETTASSTTTAPVSTTTATTTSTPTGVAAAFKSRAAAETREEEWRNIPGSAARECVDVEKFQHLARQVGPNARDIHWNCDRRIGAGAVSLRSGAPRYRGSSDTSRESTYQLKIYWVGLARDPRLRSSHRAQSPRIPRGHPFEATHFSFGSQGSFTASGVVIPAQGNGASSRHRPISGAATTS